MANEITITIKTITGEAMAGLKKFNAELKEGQKAVRDWKPLTDTMRNVGLGLTAAGALGTVAIKKFYTAAMDQKKAEMDLASAIQNTGGTWEQYKGRVLATTSALQDQTGIADEEQIRTLARLTTILGSTDKAMEALEPTLNLGARTGKDFGAAADSIARFLKGETDSLRGTGISVKKNTSYQTRLNLVTKAYAGAAASQKTAMDDLNTATDRLNESIGDALIPNIDWGARKLTALVKVVTKLPDPIKNVAVTTGLVGTAAADFLGPMLLALSQLPGAINTIKSFGLALKGLIPLLTTVGLRAAAIGIGILAIYEGYKVLQNITGNGPGAGPVPVGTPKGLPTATAQPVGSLPEAGPGGSVYEVPWGKGTVTVGTKGANLGENLLGLASGGVVPGPLGSPRLAMVHGGETVTPAGGRGGVNINIGSLSVTGGGSDIDMRRQARAFLDIVREELRTRTANRSLA